MDKSRGRYRLRARPVDTGEVQSISQSSNDKSNEFERLHTRSAHLGYSALRRMISHEAVTGLDDVGSCCIREGASGSPR